jgi:hypothetical protein
VKITRDVSDLKQILFSAILAVIAQGILLFTLSWNVVAVIGCVILDILLFITGLADWIYFSREIILDAYGCTFVLNGVTKRFDWEEIELRHTENAWFFFGDAEIPGEGIILSAKPISKPEVIGAMTYCRFTNPSTSVFIRFSGVTKTSAKLVYRGFVADKAELLDFLKTQHTRTERWEIPYMDA